MSKKKWALFVLLLVASAAIGVFIGVQYREDTHNDMLLITLGTVAGARGDIASLRAELKAHCDKLEQHNKDALYWKGGGKQTP